MVPISAHYLTVGELAVLHVVVSIQRPDAGIRVVERVLAHAVRETFLTNDKLNNQARKEIHTYQMTNSS